MITARIAPGSRLARRLATTAGQLAQAAAQARRTPHPWRNAALLWPLFTKD